MIFPQELYDRNTYTMVFFLSYKDFCMCLLKFCFGDFLVFGRIPHTPLPSLLCRYV